MCHSRSVCTKTGPDCVLLTSVLSPTAKQGALLRPLSTHWYHLLPTNGRSFTAAFEIINQTVHCWPRIHPSNLFCKNSSGFPTFRPFHFRSLQVPTGAMCHWSDERHALGSLFLLLSPPLDHARFFYNYRDAHSPLAIASLANVRFSWT